MYPSNSGSSALPPLHTAARTGNVDEVKRLVTAGSDVNGRDTDGATALHWAKSASVTKYLLEKNANINAEDSNGRRPLHWANEANIDPGVLNTLLAHPNINIDAPDHYGQTALHLAARIGNDAMVQKLLATKKATLVAKDKEGRTPLDLAIQNRCLSTVLLLLKAGAQLINPTPLLNLWDSEGRTLLHEAVRLAVLPQATDMDRQWVTDLVQLGFDIFAQDREGHCPFSLVMQAASQVASGSKAEKKLRVLLAALKEGAKPLPTTGERSKRVQEWLEADRAFSQHYQELLSWISPELLEAFTKRYARYQAIYQGIYRNNVVYSPLPTKTEWQEDIKWARHEEERLRQRLTALDESMRGYRQQANVLLDNDCWSLLMSGKSKTEQSELAQIYNSFMGRNAFATDNGGWNLHLPETRLLPIFSTPERIRYLQGLSVIERLQEIQRLMKECEQLKLKKQQAAQQSAFAEAVTKRASDVENLPRFVHTYGATAENLLVPAPGPTATATTQTLIPAASAGPAATLVAQPSTLNLLVPGSDATENSEVEPLQAEVLREVQNQHRKLERSYTFHINVLEEQLARLQAQPAAAAASFSTDNFQALQQERILLMTAYQSYQETFTKCATLLRTPRQGDFYASVYLHLSNFLKTGTLPTSQSEAINVASLPHAEASDIETLANRVAQELTERHAQQIDYLSRDAARLLGERVVLHIAKYLGQLNEPISTLPVAEQLLSAVELHTLIGEANSAVTAASASSQSVENLARHSLFAIPAIAHQNQSRLNAPVADNNILAVEDFFIAPPASSSLVVEDEEQAGIARRGVLASRP